MAKEADAVLLGAVGGPKWEPLDIAVRPEKGLLGLRAGLNLFSNLRPAILYPQLAGASSLRPEIVAGSGHHDRARTDRWHLFRSATRHSRARGRASARASTPWSTPSTRLSASSARPAISR
jgi:hypothetical protein